MRVFVAARLPEHVHASLDAACDRLRDRLGDVRWLPRESRHVTLAFLGSVPAASIDAIVAIVDETFHACPPIEARLAGIDGFPSAAHARVVVARIEASELRRYRALLATRLRDAGFAIEERGFAPHVTLARSRTATAVPCVEALSRAPFSIARIEVLRSHLRASGARYEALAVTDLRRSARP